MNINNNILQPTNEKLETLKTGRVNNNKVDIVLEKNDQRFLISEEKVDLKALSSELKAKGFAPAVMVELTSLDKDKNGFLEESDLKATTLKEARGVAKTELDNNHKGVINSAKKDLAEDKENLKSFVKGTVGGSLGMGAFMGGVTGFVVAEGGTIVNALKVGGGVGIGAALLMGTFMIFDFFGTGILSDKKDIKVKEINIKALEKETVPQEDINHLAEQKLNTYNNLAIKSKEIKVIK